MSARDRRHPGDGTRSAVRGYAWFCGAFLLLQGGSTLAARLLPEFDRAFPLLLRATRMVPAHSVLHLATALLAFAALAAGARATWWFAALFGSFYAGLGLLGLLAGRGRLATPESAGDLCGGSMGLGLQPFDHPFHILLGLVGLVAALATPRPSAGAASATRAEASRREQP